MGRERWSTGIARGRTRSRTTQVCAPHRPHNSDGKLHRIHERINIRLWVLGCRSKRGLREQLRGTRARPPCASLEGARYTRESSAQAQQSLWPTFTAGLHAHAMSMQRQCDQRHEVKVGQSATRALSLHMHGAAIGGGPSACTEMQVQCPTERT